MKLSKHETLKMQSICVKQRTANTNTYFHAIIRSQTVYISTCMYTGRDLLFSVRRPTASDSVYYIFLSSFLSTCKNRIYLMFF